MPTEARGNYLPEPRLLTRDKDLSQPATRVDTTCWQLFRPAINTAHFYFLLLQKLCVITDSDAKRRAAIESLYVTRPIRVAFAWPIMG